MFMMRQVPSNDDSFAVKVDVFESTQVALNIEFLSLLPASINQSSFFIELAEEMQLTFCEQIDNGCPVLLGLWSNILRAEKRLEELVQSWEEERNSAQFAKTLTTSVPCSLPADENKTTQVDLLSNEPVSQLGTQCVVDSALLVPSSNPGVSCGYESPEISQHPQLFIVSSEVGQFQNPQLLRCTFSNVKTALNNNSEEQTKEVPANSTKDREDNSSIKEIYVDIALNPTKNSNKNKSTNRCLELKASSDQHPLDKLCQLLCIDEDETVEKRLLEAERKRKHENKVPYRYFCDQCSFKTKRETHLLKHVKFHEKIKDVFCCDQCDFKTIRESVLCRHKIQHSTTKLHCKLCTYTTDNPNLLLKHVQVKHNQRNRRKVRCTFCDFCATTPRDLHRHLQLFHKADDGPKFLKCSKCPYKTKLRAHLSRHDNDVHGSLRQFLCHYCGKSFKRNDTLTQHKTIHGEVKKTFTCQHCGKVCTSSVFLREHLATHTTDRPFLCDVCGSSFKTRGATQRHKRVMHSTTHTLFPCTQCERAFKSRTDLSRHRKTHRLKTEATIVPAIISGANVQEVVSTPITIQVVYTKQLDTNNQDVTIK